MEQTATFMIQVDQIMKIAETLKRVTVAMALIGLLAGQSFAAQPTKPIDIAMYQGKVLVGQVVNEKGAPKVNAQVVVQSTTGEKANVVTNKSGYFAANLPRGGTYAVTESGATTIVRAWTANTAPPKAGKALLVVSGKQTVLGQCCDAAGCDGGCGGGGCDSGCGLLGSSSGLIFAGIAAGAITLGVVELGNGS